MNAQVKQRILKLIAQKNKLRDKKQQLDLKSINKWTDKDELELLIIKDELDDVERALNSAVINRETLHI
jgi:hypothetical protein